MTGALISTLTGAAAGDAIGNSTEQVVTLSNGNFLVYKASWKNGTVSKTGFVTWGNGTAGVTGVVLSSNSLVGSSSNDGFGTSITVLSDGNYLVGS